ncbi:MAG: hypothetical protein K2H49_06355, partial [Muribaculaceae bacterium]|nr:hypothetical protein [Muribaculaceae bacterium]
SKTVKGKPGQKIIMEIAAEQGPNVFTVQVSNGDQKSLVTKVEAYIGVYIPATPEMSDVTFTPDLLSMTIAWEPVTTADDGEGYVNPATVVYDLYQLNMITDSWDLIEEGLTENSYTYEKEPGSAQEIVMIGVLARNEAGDNGMLVMAMTILGTPYDLPIYEDYDDRGNMNTDPWLTTYPSGEAKWGLYFNYDVTDDPSDRGISMVAHGKDGAIARLATPRFSTKDQENVSLTLELIKSNMPSVRILGEVYGEDPEEIAEIGDLTFNNRIEKYTLELPEKYLNRDWIGLIIEVEFVEDNQMLVMESISINGGENSVSAIDSDDVRIYAENGQIRATGLNGKAVCVTDVNGTVVGRKVNVNDAVFNVKKGVYIVTCGGKAVKVIN